MTLTVTLVGCGTAPEPRPTAIESDSSEVRVVRTILTEWNDTLALHAHPTTQVPLPDDSLANPLGSVTTAIVLSDGRIALIDRQQQTVVSYDRSGRQLFGVGGRGRGPGEFEDANLLRETDGGGLEVYDSRLGRFTSFGPDGSLAHVLTLSREYFARPPAKAWRLDHDQILAWEYNIGNGHVIARSGNAERWATIGILRVVSLETGLADTLRIAPAWEMIRDGSRLWVAPFAAAASLAVVDGKVFFATGKTHAIEVLRPANGLLASFVFPTRDVPLNKATLTEMEASGRAQSASDGVAFEAGVIFDPDLQPEIQPAIDALKVDRTGTIWARGFEPFQSGAESWWLITPEGTYRGLVQMPDRCRLLSFGAYSMVIRRLDEMDVPSVEVWSLPRVMPSRAATAIKISPGGAG